MGNRVEFFGSLPTQLWAVEFQSQVDGQWLLVGVFKTLKGAEKELAHWLYPPARIREARIEWR